MSWKGGVSECSLGVRRDTYSAGDHWFLRMSTVRKKVSEWSSESSPKRDSRHCEGKIGVSKHRSRGVSSHETHDSSLSVDVGVVNLQRGTISTEWRFATRAHSTHLSQKLYFGRAKRVVDGKYDTEVEYTAFVDAVRLRDKRRG